VLEGVPSVVEADGTTRYTLFELVMNVVGTKIDDASAEVAASKDVLDVCDEDNEGELVFGKICDAKESVLAPLVCEVVVDRVIGNGCIVVEEVDIGKLVKMAIVLPVVVVVDVGATELEVLLLEPQNGRAATASSVVTGLHPGRAGNVPLIGSLTVSGA